MEKEGAAEEGLQATLAWVLLFLVLLALYHICPGLYEIEAC